MSGIAHLVFVVRQVKFTLAEAWLLSITLKNRWSEAHDQGTTDVIANTRNLLLQIEREACTVQFHLYYCGKYVLE